MAKLVKNAITATDHSELKKVSRKAGKESKA